MMRVELEGESREWAFSAPGDEVIRVGARPDGSAEFMIGAELTDTLELAAIDTPNDLARELATIARHFFALGFRHRGYCVRRALGLALNEARVCYGTENYQQYGLRK